MERTLVLVKPDGVQRGLIDHVVETFAGPHDFLNWYWYNATGTIRQGMSCLEVAIGEVINAVDIPLAAPFAAASITPSPVGGFIAAHIVTDRR